MLKESVVIIIKSLRITNSIFLQEIALLDRGVEYKEGDPLPEGACFYYRVLSKDKFSSTKITDYSGEGLLLTLDDLAKFLMEKPK